MSQACNLLFVYGTLMRCDSGAIGRLQRARLAMESRVLGNAWISGRLFNLGRYPGVVPSGGADIVHGELLELIDAERSLRWLDEYEGIVSSQLPPNEYERVLHPVERAEGEVVSAFVYAYRRDIESAVLILSGRWIDAERPAD